MEKNSRFSPIFLSNGKIKALCMKENPFDGSNDLPAIFHLIELVQFLSHGRFS